MKTIQNILAFFLVLAIFLGLGWLVFVGGKFLITQFQLLNPEAATILLMGAITALICTFIIVFAINNHNTKGDLHVHPQKTAIYTDFINYYIAIRENIRQDGSVNYRFRSDMTLWASQNVLKQYLLFNKYLDELTPSNPKVLDQAERVIFEMRKDIGQGNFGIKKGDLDKIIFPGNHPVQK